MNTYLDESGDLGFTLDLPNRAGGSSRYLTISHISFSDADRKYVKRLVRELFKILNYNIKTEVKGASFDDATARSIAIKICKLIRTRPDIKIGSITVKKENVQEALREDKNTLYNYVTGLLLPKYFSQFPIVNFYPDKRSIKVDNKFILNGYLITLIRSEYNSKTTVNYLPTDSKQVQELWVADWITNFIWRHHEDGRSEAYKVLKPFIYEKLCFFNPQTKSK